MKSGSSEPPRGRTRTEAKAATRAQLLAVARELAEDRGLGAVTAREIARRAGVANGTVFAHFPDKAAIGEALLHDHVERALAEGLRDVPAGDLVAQLLHVVRPLFRAYLVNPALSRELLSAGLFPAQRGSGPLHDQLAQFQAWVGGRLSEAHARGETRLALPDAFAGFFALYFGVLVAGLRGDVPADGMAPLLERLLRQFFGIGGGSCA